jgi:hypothetical protein
MSLQTGESNLSLALNSRPQVASTGTHATPLVCKQVALQIHHFSRRESAVEEPSLRIFFRARFRAKALFTRRFSPGFK